MLVKISCQCLTLLTAVLLGPFETLITGASASALAYLFHIIAPPRNQTPPPRSRPRPHRFKCVTLSGHYDSPTVCVKHVHKTH